MAADPANRINDDDLLADAIPIDHLDEDDEFAPLEVETDALPGIKSRKQSDKSMIQVFGGERVPHETHWSRATNVTGTGATHVKTFFAKLRPDAIEHLDQQVNQWLDKHPEYEVKFVSTSVGRLVGKNIEDALFMNVWV